MQSREGTGNFDSAELIPDRPVLCGVCHQAILFTSLRGGCCCFESMKTLLFSLGFVFPILPLHASLDFAHEVAPILEKHCVECHGGEKSKGGFSINTRALVLDADVLKLGHPGDSLMIEVLTEKDPDLRMPPPGKKKEALNAAEIKILSRWIAAGAPWTEGFTFAADRYEPPLRPRPVKLPPGPADANPIDLIDRKSVV